MTELKIMISTNNKEKLVINSLLCRFLSEHLLSLLGDLREAFILGEHDSVVTAYSFFVSAFATAYALDIVDYHDVQKFNVLIRDLLKLGRAYNFSPLICFIDAL